MDKKFFEVRRANTFDIEEIQILAKKSFKMYTENAGITEIVTPLDETYNICAKSPLLQVWDG